MCLFSLGDSDNLQEPDSSPSAIINSDGKVTLGGQKKISIQCAQDVYLFPFDRQVCDTTIKSRVYKESQMSPKVALHLEHAHLDKESQEFSITGHEVSYKNIYDDRLYITVKIT